MGASPFKNGRIEPFILNPGESRTFNYGQSSETFENNTSEKLWIPWFEKVKELKIPHGYIQNPDGRLEPDWGLIKAQAKCDSDEFWKKNFRKKVIQTSKQ